MSIKIRFSKNDFLILPTFPIVNVLKWYFWYQCLEFVGDSYQHTPTHYSRLVSVSCSVIRLLYLLVCNTHYHCLLIVLSLMVSCVPVTQGLPLDKLLLVAWTLLAGRMDIISWSHGHYCHKYVQNYAF